MDFFYLMLMIVVGVVFVLGGFFVSRLLAPDYPDSVKNSSYECGEIPYGAAWTRFNVGYYIFALLFLVFDVDVALCFPWAVVLKEIGVRALVEGGIFLLIVFYGLVFAWRKGFLVWR